MRNLLCSTAVAVLAAAISQQAFAADEAVTAAPAEATTASAVDASATATLAEVVVSATKRDTNLQDTPIAISVVGAEAMADRHVQSLLNLADGAIPSLRIATFEARQSALTVGIRGIVPFDANQTARDQGVGIYLDGIYLGRQQGLNAALFDIERIEVLRGPQGTLFGRNTEGGAVSIVTRAPTGQFGGRIVAGVGNYGAYNAELHHDFPEIANISVKVDGLIQHQDASIKNPLQGEFGWNYYNRVGGRLTALWRPTDNFSLEVAYDRAKDENTPFYSQLINYNPQGKTVRTIAQMQASPTIPAGFIAPLPALVQVQADRATVADIGVPQQPSVDNTEGLMAIAKYKFNGNLEFRSLSAVRGVTTEQWDNSGGAHRTVFTPNGRFSRYSLSDLSQTQFSQEFQLVGGSEQLDWVAGLYYFNERAKEEAATPSTNQWNADGAAYSILSPLTAGNAWQRELWTLQRGSRAKAKSYAAFGQFTYTPASVPAFHLTAGGRYTQDKRDGTLYIVQNKPTNFKFTFDDGRFDPMVTLAYDVNPDVNVYAKYATGYRAGGANSRSQTFEAFNPEVVKSYELGLKSEFFERRVRFNLAGYIMNRTGTQTDFDNVDINPLSPTFNLHTEETRNAPGTSRIKGIEAELTVHPVEGLTLGLSYAYTDIKVPPTPNPFLNNALIPVYVVFTPPHAASGTIDYVYPLANDMRLRLHLDGNYSDAMYSFQSEPVKTDSSFLVNGSIALADIPMGSSGSRATFSVWSRNLFNESHIYRRSAANAGTLGDYANFNPARTFGAELSLKY